MTESEWYESQEGNTSEEIPRLPRASIAVVLADTTAGWMERFRFPDLCIFSVGLISVLALTGWMFDVQALKSIGPNLTTMKANTAACFSLSAAALQLSRKRNFRGFRAAWIYGILFLVSIVAGLTLYEYVSGWNIGIDELLFRDAEHAGTPSPAGRMAPATALIFLLISGAIALIDLAPRTSQFLTMTGSLLGLIGLIGYLDNLPTLYGAGRFTSLALHTVISFILLCAGILASRPERGLGALLRAGRGERTPIKAMLAGAVMIPLVFGTVTLAGQRAGWYGGEFTLALFSVLLIVVMVTLVWVTELERQKLDAKRVQAERGVQRLNLELENRVRERTAELREANRELESFSYSVSHDLRAPLRSMDSFSQFLLEDHADLLPEEGKSYLRRIRVNSQRMGQLIADLLELSRLSRTEVRRDTIHVSSMALSIREELRNREPFRNVAWEITPGLQCEADPRLLRVVLENLLGNAWKFTSKTPEARISFGRTTTADKVYFVRDNGAGFNMKYADQLFVPFQRLHQATEFEGTGIGLATVERIVHKHHGKIWAEGHTGQGAVFYFSLGDQTRAA